MKKSTIILLTFLVIIFACKKESKEEIEARDDKLTLQRTNYTGNELRIDGYYCQKIDGMYYSCYFFYNNGTLLYGGGGLTEIEMQNLETTFSNGSFYNTAKDIKYFWGLYNINGNSIAFERWYPSSGGSLPASIRSGIILNDSTFQITQSIRSNGSESTQKNEIYYYKKFSPKPDSTNQYIP